MTTKADDTNAVLDDYRSLSEEHQTLVAALMKELLKSSTALKQSDDATAVSQHHAQMNSTSHT